MHPAATATVCGVSASRPSRTPTRPAPRVEGDPLFGNGGRPFDGIEHLVSDEDPDTALCGVDQTGVPWDQGWPICEACRVAAESRLS